MESSIERIQLAEKFEEHDNDIFFFFFCLPLGSKFSLSVKQFDILFYTYV